MSAWTDYAATLLPAVQAVRAAGGPPAWLSLAMAAHESGVPPQPGCTLLVEGNPWGVTCHTSRYPCHATASGYSFQVYPTLLDAASDLIVALGPQRLQYASDPVAFMDNLQATGWDYPPGGYADSVLYTWGPPATAALKAIGVDVNTGQPPAPSGGPQGGGSTPGQIIARRPSLLFVVLGLLGAAGIAAIGEGELHR
ncbi:hypothetical protein [Thiomonas sp.]